MHVNEKLPMNAFATVPGCSPDSDMCGTSQIMSHTRGYDRSSEKENDLTNNSSGGSSFYPFSPFPGVNELPTFASDDFSHCVYFRRVRTVFPCLSQRWNNQRPLFKLTFPPPPSTHLRWELTRTDNPWTRELPHICSSAHMDPLEMSL